MRLGVGPSTSTVYAEASLFRTGVLMKTQLLPSQVLALVLTGVASTSCFIWPETGMGSCPESRDELLEGSWTLRADGTVEPYNGDPLVDPTTEEGCEVLCEDAARWAMATVETIHSCETELTYPPADTGSAGDTGAEATGLVRVTCDATIQPICYGGRHTDLLAQRAQGRGQTDVARWLAREAAGEAGSVHAFRQLSRELSTHGAPADLVEAARSAARDEVRHTRMVRRLSDHHGGRPAPAQPRAAPARGLFEVALENAVEGCVHETFAAARAGWQARHATDGDIRSVSRVLARDEARHADLAAAIHAWAMEVLPPAQAEAIETARQHAWTRIAESPETLSPSDTARLGLPEPHQRRALIQALAAGLGVALA
jgi:rubrerythrin